MLCADWEVHHRKIDTTLFRVLAMLSKFLTGMMNLKENILRENHIDVVEASIRCLESALVMFQSNISEPKFGVAIEIANLVYDVFLAHSSVGDTCINLHLKCLSIYAEILKQPLRDIPASIICNALHVVRVIANYNAQHWHPENKFDSDKQQPLLEIFNVLIIIISRHGEKIESEASLCISISEVIEALFSMYLIKRYLLLFGYCSRFSLHVC